VAISVLLRICEYLDCNIGDICDAVKTDINDY
jgi:DNA-binding Xre family transcriptional regulator